MPHSVLYVPVRELERYVRGRYEVEGPEWLSPDRDHIHAHITLLGPFVDPEEIDKDGLDAQLAAFFAGVAPFSFTLSDIQVFPSGLAYLRPEPASEFVRLTAALVERYPAYAPYAGEFEPVPHLSLCAVRHDHDVQEVRDQLAALLPVQARASEVRLVAYARNDTRTRRTFRLGTPAGPWAASSSITT